MFKFENLDKVTRPFIIKAIEEAEQTNNIYYSTRFNENGRTSWSSLLKKAANEHDEHWLAYQIESNVLMKDFEGARTRLGGYSIKHVPHKAAETMAEGQFNRFYMLGLCKRARQEEISQLEVYRAKPTSQHRSSSEAIIGKQFLVDEIEQQLKEIKNCFNSPLLKPNSGLCIRIPK